MNPRRPTRQITVGDDRTGKILVGGGLHGTTPAPVTVQTMTAGYTHEIDKCVAEIHRMHTAGADVVRVEAQAMGSGGPEFLERINDRAQLLELDRVGEIEI